MSSTKPKPVRSAPPVPKTAPASKNASPPRTAAPGPVSAAPGAVAAAPGAVSAPALPSSPKRDFTVAKLDVKNGLPETKLGQDPPVSAQINFIMKHQNALSESVKQTIVKLVMSEFTPDTPPPPSIIKSVRGKTSKYVDVSLDNCQGDLVTQIYRVVRSHVAMLNTTAKSEDS